MGKGGKNAENNQNINVFVRCRPRNTSEIKSGSPSIVDCLPSKRDISVRQDISYLDKGCTKTFSFDKVFDPNCKQIDVYKAVAAPIIEEVLLGYNCTIFAYGQTGTGKTFSMEGERTQGKDISWEKDPLSGIIPRAMHHLFARLAQQSDCAEFSVRVSFLEIYNEEIFDLLGTSLDTQRMRIYDDAARKGSVVVQGLEEVIVRDRDEVYSILEKGANKRQTAATLLNAHSSRSHSIFSVTIHMKENNINGEEMLKTGKLNLVDLAGSENIGRSGAVEKRAREAGTINQSLLTLGRVITALVERAPHVPYRESKLTRLLQDSLGGRTKTSIIATISPAACNLEETLSTLEYAFRAKNIMNKPEINQKMTKKALIKEYNEEIDKLKKDLLAAREKNGIFIAEENYMALQQQLASQKNRIEEYQDKITCMEKEMAKINDLFGETQEELERRTNDLDRMTQRQRETQHLVTKHQENEEKLYKEASNLLDTVDETVNDIEGLHAKLDRKVMVDKENKSCISSFRSSVFDILNETKEDVHDFIDKENQYQEKVVTSIGNMMKVVEDDFEALRSLASTVEQSRSEKISNIVDQDKEYHEHQRSEREEMCRKINDCKGVMFQKTDEFNQAQFLNMVQKLQDVTERFQAGQTQFWKLFNDCLKQQRTNISEFTDRHEKQLDKLSQIVSTHTAEQKQSLHEISTMSQKSAQQQQTLVKTLHDSVMGSVLETISRSMQQVSDSLHDQLQKTTSELSVKLNNDADMVVQKLTGSSESEDKLEEAFQVNQLFVHAEALKFRQSNDDVCCQWISEGEKISNEMKGLTMDAASHTKEMKQMEEDFVETLKNLIEDQSGTVQIFSQAQEASSYQRMEQLVRDREAITSEDNDFSKRHMSCLENTQVKVNDHCQELSADSSMHIESNVTWASKTKDAIDSLNHKVLNFFDNEMREDQPTGTTPQRRQFTYPRVLTKTGDHGSLVKQFRFTHGLPSTPVLELVKEEGSTPGSNNNSYLDGLMNPSPCIQQNEGTTGQPTEALSDKENLAGHKTPPVKEFGRDKQAKNILKQKRPLQPTQAN